MAHNPVINSLTLLISPHQTEPFCLTTLTPAYRAAAHEAVCTSTAAPFSEQSPYQICPLSFPCSLGSTQTCYFRSQNQHLALDAYRETSILIWGKLKYASAANYAYEESRNRTQTGCSHCTPSAQICLVCVYVFPKHVASTAAFTCTLMFRVHLMLPKILLAQPTIQPAGDVWSSEGCDKHPRWDPWPST